ncbi:MAG: twin-arginine translocation signal domain-containing protein [Pirellulales bacterium]|nr:twin-arginine translocation signal domain-containing protein [Pirellulales bacterium]
MNGNTTRRDFLRASAAAGGCLALGGVSAARRPSRAGEQPPTGPIPAGSQVGSSAKAIAKAPVIVITQAVSRDVNPRAGAWAYIVEVLRRAGLFFEELSPTQLPILAGRSDAIIVLAGHLRLTSPERELLATLVENGNSLLGIGGTSGLERVFGVSGMSPLAEGWMKVSAEDHPLTAGLRSSLHVFGGYVAKPGSAASLAQVEGGVQRTARGSAILENRLGQGRAILLAPDLLFSIVHMQQGLPVLQDGKPAPEDSARVDEGTLKAEDGLVLDWQRDRSPMRPDDGPVFLEPISDELREIILRGIFHAADQRGVALPMLWYWPSGLKAVGHISHDSDGNDPKKAETTREVMNRSNVKSTWCILYPGGYPRPFYDALKDQQFEIALHYDAHTGGEETSWSKDNLILQHQWLLKEAGLEQVISNKNHYTRWENRLDFFRWCEDVGIRCDQTRGPSKKGTIGFSLGGSQPYFPMDDQADSPRFLEVLEVNMLTQDLVHICPGEYGRQLVDSVLRHHGVAHFLFHPAHVVKPPVADALCGLIDYGRSQGLQWWTSEEIYRWERRRRAVEVQFETGTSLTLRSAEPLRQATLLVLSPRKTPQPLSLNGRPAQGERRTVHGFEFQAVTADLAREITLRIG